MAVSPLFEELLRDLLSPLGSVSLRRMFSGSGVYCDGVMFGLVMDDAFYLKCDEQTRSDYEAEGSEPFSYRGRGKTIATSYWRTPERLLDEPDELVAWARIALGIALGMARERASTKRSKVTVTRRKATKAKPAAVRST